MDVLGHVRTQADRGRRFEVGGAEAAADLLRANGLEAARAQIVCDAIALHTSAGIADQKGQRDRPYPRRDRNGLGSDAELAPGELAAQVHDRYPRLDMARCLTDAIVSQAQGRPRKAPPYTLPGELARERAAGSSGTGMERLAGPGALGILTRDCPFAPACEQPPRPRSSARERSRS